MKINKINISQNQNQFVFQKLHRTKKHQKKSYMEKLLITFSHENHINFLELVFKLICFYYNLNITYSKEISLSMEFFVMFLLK